MNGALSDAGRPKHNNRERSADVKGKGNGKRAGLLLAAGLLLLGSAASAQTTTAKGFYLNRFAPAEAGSDWFAADSLDLRGNNRLAVGLLFDYAHEPLVIRDADGHAVAKPVAHQLFGHLGASYVLWERLRLAAVLPVLLVNDGDTGAVGDVRYVAKDAPAFGDMRLGVDVGLFGHHGDPLRVAVGLQAYLPTGRKSRYTSDGKARFVPHVAAAGDLGIWSYGAAVAFDGRFRDDTVVNQPLGPTLGFLLAGGARVLDGALLLGPELQGETSLEGDHAFTGGGSVLELLLGAHYAIDDAWRLGVGAARDFTTAVGSPSFRLLAQVAFVMPAARAAPAASPPVSAEVAAPLPVDSDKDGIADALDACPHEVGPASKDKRTNGCPDTDRDGVVDRDDACPDAPGLPSPTKEKNGCPVPPDGDHDGVVDAEDACPAEAGPASDVKATNGCPVPPDGDHDGVVDAADACPGEPGVADPDPAKNGCPKVRLVSGEIQILDRIEFENNKAAIRPVSEPVLVAVARILGEHPELEKVRVEGYTDNKGKPSKNRKLSQSRVEAVVSWLTAHGIDKARLVAQGFGQENPIADNKTEEGRSRNRRVQFVIVKKATEAP